jgi:hypothetical protein
MTKARTQVTAAFAAAGLVLALILAISPHATIIADEGSVEIYGIDILGLTNKAMRLAEQQFPAY